MKESWTHAGCVLTFEPRAYLMRWRSGNETEASLPQTMPSIGVLMSGTADEKVPGP